MRILIQNRTYKGSHFGGDQVQTEAYVQALRELGHIADYSPVMFNVPMQNYDVAWVMHINFGWTMNQINSIRSQGKPYYLFAIYYPTIIETSISQMRDMLLGSVFTFCLSNAERNEMIRNLSLTEKEQEKVKIIPNGVDKSIFFPKNEVQKEYLMTAGRYEGGKGHLRVIEIASDLNVPVLTCGTKNDMNYFNQCANYPFDKKRLLGLLNPLELADAYRKAKVYVCASGSERNNLCLLEAAACGCQLVSTTGNRGNEWYGDKLITCNADDREDMKNAVYKSWNSNIMFTDTVKDWKDVVQMVLDTK